MKTVKIIVALLLCIVWIVITNLKVASINSLGSILTFKSGILNVPLENQRSLELQSQQYEASIFVDTLGIPHIYGSEIEDTGFALGYMHAKDRYFQMELMSRMVAGEMSEIFGPSSLESDKFWLPYEFERKAAEILDEYKNNSKELYSFLISYSDGINKCIESNHVSDPFYAIIDSNPRPWKPEYSILVNWYMSNLLAYQNRDLAQQEIIDKLTPEEINKFFPPTPEDLITILKPSKFDADSIGISSIEKSNNNLNEVGDYMIGENNDDIGSNNWAINALKTKNGFAVLANDIHLPLMLPGAFYQCHMVSNEMKVYGYSIPGVPVIISGHNDKISWGITNGEWDVLDLYKLKTKNDSLYFYIDQWRAFEKDEYTITPKGETPLTFSQLRSVHGKVYKGADGDYYSEKWYPSEKSYAVKSFFNIMRSNTWSDFKSALKNYDYPSQNFIYADVTDTIGIVCAGKLPSRGNSLKTGLKDGKIRVEEVNFVDSLWNLNNPKDHYLFSANQQPIQNNYYFGSHWHKDDFRVNRINQLLKANNSWNIDDLKQMQLDELDLSYFDFLKLKDHYKVPNNYKFIFDHLDDWNGQMTENKLAPLIYEIVRESVMSESELFSKINLGVQQRPSFKFFIKYLNHLNPKDSKPFLEKQRYFENILKRADSILVTNYGDDWMKKTYADKSKFTINNIMFIPGFGEEISNMGGNKNTISMNADAHAAFRNIFEMSERGIKGWTIMAGGQSGKINSKHYKDQLDYWTKGKYFETQYFDDHNKLKNIETTIFIQK